MERKKNKGGKKKVLSNRAYKFRIYPNKEQEILINKTIGCARLIYNLMLADKIEYYKENKSILYNKPSQYKQKEEYSFLKEVDSLALCNSQINLNTAFTNLKKQPNIGFPKFKSKKRSKLRYTTNNQNGTVNIIENKLIKLPKVGLVKCIVHRNIPEDYEIKSATIERTASDEYYVSILFEYSFTPPVIELDKERAIGLDYSSPNFYVDSNNQIPEKQRYYRESEEKLGKEQRKLSHMMYNSNNYRKQKVKVAKAHQHIANKRKDFCHKESTRIANTYDIVCIEDINLRSLAQTLHLGKSTNDNGFGMFRVFLEYKLKERGKVFIKVDKWYPSSKTCNNCGSKNTELQLSDRTFVCKECGCVIDRDYNAALNILQEGLKQVT